MARYEVFSIAGDGSLVLDVQTDLIEALSTRTVIPLLPTGSAPMQIDRLNPKLVFDGEEYVLMTDLVSSVPRRALGEPLGNLSSEHDRITAALDMLFYGF